VGKGLTRGILEGENMKKKMLTAVLGGTAVATLAFASASALTVDGGTIQVGDDGVTCDSNGVKANWGLETDDNTVRSVRIDGIDSACAGAEMFVKVDDMAVKKVLLTTSGSASIPFAAPYLAPEDIESIRIWIEG
jgi:hypothetical protein